jgi:hypothetical protein
MGRYLDLAKAVEAADFCGKVAFTPQSGEIGLKSEVEQVSPLGSTKFDSDLGCEISELCEISPAAGVATCPPGGRAVLLQVPDGVPVEWAQGVADLLTMPAHPDWPDSGWRALREDALRFLKHWAAPAHAFGWSGLDLFAVHIDAPRARIDCMGLVPLLGGRPVAALTEDSAAITGESGATLTYRKRKTWPPECRSVWELGQD